ncbi:hypothetical protein HELRODRAFT_192237 [Helobdella robusta]|uniref:Craniofacial development protein 1 n=1 Tax=Helobdella robusta TaxID=6412 RepID=T1FTR0_HELRO|nr:hypothetical protein HELRODRAFT_192237 [Helobdella robusta]ESO01708.1 hypothetical protein HELRODRAFT_192237 [Helobdella robusta]
MPNVVDEEDFSSDSDDEDYVPTEGVLASEEENSGEDESALFANDDDVKDDNGDVADAAAKKNGRGCRQKKLQKKCTTKSKPLKNIDNEDISKEEASQNLKNDEESKRKSDSLWADFLKDVGGPTKKTNNEKVTIVKEFNFAGETVRVATEVDADSKEAKKLSTTSSVTSSLITPLTSTSSSSSSSSSALTTSSASSSSTSSSTTLKTSAAAPPSSSSVFSKLPGPKRPSGGLNSLLENFQKKPKMSVLDKSKLDWIGFRKDEGIEEELQQHNRGKNGYLERMAFLQRTDLRQYELERNLRMSSGRKPPL